MASMQSPISRGGTIRRSGTRRLADGPPRRAKGYDIVQQSIKQLHPPEDRAGGTSDIDIVFVPGLGAHPEESWESTKTGFNWTTSEDGIAKDFPRARILLFMYESVWAGSLKVKQQFMDNIASSLLGCLKSKRKNCKSRPIVFIGHSMGGLVIANAVVLAYRRREYYPGMFETISATIFFGTPFKGTEFGVWATAYAHEAEKSGQAWYSKLLEFISPGDEALRGLREEFAQLIVKLSPKIQAVCFWEQEPTDFTKLANLPGHSDYTKSLLPTGSADFVTRESAVLDGIEMQFGLKCDHRNLVKFDGPKDERWNQTVRDHVKWTIKEAPLICKNRLLAVGGIDWPAFKGIMDALGGTQVERRRGELAKTITPSSWLTAASEYSQWFGSTKAPDDQAAPEKPSVDCVWVRGREGRGKTGATLSALGHVETFIKDSLKQSKGQDMIMLAYFLCEPSTDYFTAEDLLKSLLGQLINQHTRLATHAKIFVKEKVSLSEGTSKSQKDGASKSQAQPTVENLWQCLQDMLSDESVGRRVYFVINNLHVLPEESDSTVKLMSYLQQEVQSINSIEDESDWTGVSAKWFITSRDTESVRKTLSAANVRLIDLEDKQYRNKVQIDLRLHAKARVATLQAKKKYNKALTYFASSLIGQHAQDIHWIDITCVQLESLSETESHLSVRRILEETPQDLTKLLNSAWMQIFQSSDDNGQRIKEVLRALILTFEDPTEAELSLLAGLPSIDGDDEELHSLIDQCKPFLVVQQTISFMNPAVKAHLQQNAHELLGLSDEVTRWQHGVLALRSLTHIKERFDFAESVDDPDLQQEPDTTDAEEGASQDDDASQDGHAPQDDEGDSNSERSSDDGGDEDDEDSDGTDDDDSLDTDGDSSWEDDDDDIDPEKDRLEDVALSYAVKHWLHHGSKATAEFADDLSRDEFWERDSLIRARWLVEYTRMTGDFDVFEPRELGALHVAASIGFGQLVISLVENCHSDEMDEYDSLGNTPLHFAAHFGHPKVIEELLNRGAEVDKREEEDDDTPLHMAAENGHVDVMNKLIFHKADPNAYSEFSGLVINAAISSGKIDAVKLLVDKGVSLTLERKDVKSPLAQAAAMSDNSVLDYLMREYTAELPPEEYSKALISAAGAGRMETFKKLLGFQHSDSAVQQAMNRAAKKAKWEVVTFLLEQRSDLNCDETFYRVAIGTEDKDDVLEALWEYSHGSISPATLDRSLYVATDREKYDTIRLLLDKFGADSNATGNKYGNALTAAAYDGNLEVLRLLLENKADVNSQNGWAIQTAAKSGHLAVVQELINWGADVNASAVNDRFPERTALQGATEGGRQEIAALLLQHNADPNLGGGDYAPPILAAAMFAEEEILTLLIDAKADVSVVGGGDQSTPLTNAAAFISGTRSLRKLLDAGADINSTGGDGTTALIAAAQSGDEEVVQFLLDNGADVMHSTKTGVSALRAACSSNSPSCMDILVDHVSSILSALKIAMDSGNMAVTAVVRSATAVPQGLDYDDPARDHEAFHARVQEDTLQELEYDDALKERESFHVQVRDDKRAFNNGIDEIEHHKSKDVAAPPRSNVSTPSHELFSTGMAQSYLSQPQASTEESTVYQTSHIDPTAGPQLHVHPSGQNSTEPQPYPYAAPPPLTQLYNGNGRPAPASAFQQSSSQPQVPGFLLRRKPTPAAQLPATWPAQSPGPSSTNTGQTEPTQMPYRAYAPDPGADAQGSIRPPTLESQLDYNGNPYGQTQASTANNTRPGQNQTDNAYKGGQPQQKHPPVQAGYHDVSSYDGSYWGPPQPSEPYRDNTVDYGTRSQHNSMPPPYRRAPESRPGAATPPRLPARPPVQLSYNSPATIQQHRDVRAAPYPPTVQNGQGYDPYRGPGTQAYHPDNAGGGRY